MPPPPRSPRNKPHPPIRRHPIRRRLTDGHNHLRRGRATIHARCHRRHRTRYRDRHRSAQRSRVWERCADERAQFIPDRRTTMEHPHIQRFSGVRRRRQHYGRRARDRRVRSHTHRSTSGARTGLELRRVDHVRLLSRCFRRDAAAGRHCGLDIHRSGRTAVRSCTCPDPGQPWRGSRGVDDRRSVHHAEYLGCHAHLAGQLGSGARGRVVAFQQRQ